MKSIRRHVLLGMTFYAASCYVSSANAASIESLVMPGPVVSAHSDIEQQCGSCHSPFSQAQQNQLCLTCHEEIAADLKKRSGFHGKHPDPANTECRSCHVEHKGRDADIVGLVSDGFDHNLTNFPLSEGHASQPCASCHTKPGIFRGTGQTCVGCHKTDDPHRGNLGSDCADCHTATRWSQTTFEHAAATRFRLNGAHRDVTCSRCHADQMYADTPTTCAACHALDDIHGGERGSQCSNCHTDKSWADSSFNHRRETDFDLTGRHAKIACAACHLSNMSLKKPPKDCAGCHSADDVHGGQRGANCAECHSTSRWQTAFDHLASTGFALRGAHSEVACDRCHHGSLQDPLSTECEDCHRASDPHSGALISCASCHNESSWTAQIRFDHEFTEFPLLGMHSLATCDQCHVGADFHRVGRTCADCHSTDDKHDGSLGSDCSQCHNPSGWALWQFDHAQRTTFALTGAHQDLVCSACHNSASDDPLNIASSCVSCHVSDDAHRGQFGSNCERCHSTETFTGARFD